MRKFKHDKPWGIYLAKDDNYRVSLINLKKMYREMNIPEDYARATYEAMVDSVKTGDFEICYSDEILETEDYVKMCFDDMNDSG